MVSVMACTVSADEGAEFFLRCKEAIEGNGITLLQRDKGSAGVVE